MTDTKELERLIKDNGLKKGFIAKKLGISYDWLNKKIKGEVPFKDYEIRIFCELVHIDDPNRMMELFFAPCVDKKSTK